MKEWVGKTSLSKPPPHVLVRIWTRCEGRCHITGQKIDAKKDAYEWEHIKRLADGGENRESNLAPALVAPHKEKSARENREGKKADRVRARDIGLKVKHKRGKRDGYRIPKTPLPPSRLYTGGK